MKVPVSTIPVNTSKILNELYDMPQKIADNYD